MRSTSQGMVRGFLTFLIGVFIGYGLFYSEPLFVTITQPNIPSAQALQDPRVEEALDTIESRFQGFSSVSSEDLVHGVIEGLVGGLKDRHSEFMTSEEAQEFDEVLGGDFEGIGAHISEHASGVRIDGVIPRSPSEKAGLKRGDIILSANGTQLAGMDPTEAVTYIRGKKNTLVLLEVLKSGKLVSEKISLLRDALTLPLVSSEILTGSVGYIQLVSFGEKSAQDIASMLQSLVASGATSLILDLRGNGGGYLDTAVDLISLFIPAGQSVVTTIGSTEELNAKEVSKGCSQFCTFPLVVLVDGGSASASEITAGALQDLQRALIVGEKTYGKGSVQGRFDLSDGSSLKLTVARWYTPKGRGIDGKGIEPTVVVEVTEEDVKKLYDRQKELSRELLVKKLSPTSPILAEFVSTLSGAILVPSPQL